MTVRHSLLAILAEGPAHGYGLKSAFEQTTAGAWPLNVGQVYTTLARLARDGLVQSAGEVDDQRQTWVITPSGRAALDQWFDTPVLDDPPSRDELAIKVLLAVAAGHTDVSAVIQRQRVAAMERVQQLTQRKLAADPERELPWLLLLDALILKLRAEVDWLDLCEQRLHARGEG